LNAEASPGGVLSGGEPGGGGGGGGGGGLPGGGGLGGGGGGGDPEPAATTVTVAVALALLPEWSVAVKVTVRVQPTGKLDGPLAVIVGFGSTASVAFAPERNAAIDELEESRLSTPAGATTVMLWGGVITGAVVSWTRTVVVAEPVLPALSVAVQVTVVVPSGNAEPDGGVHDALTEPSTRSLALAAP
jgi:hypothetical protein